MKYSNKVIVILSLLLALISLFLLGSCTPKYDEGEITENAKLLIESSYEINEIFFGKGLPLDSELNDGTNTDFYYISEDSKYKSEEDIKKAALAVYSEGYCDYLFAKAFVGFAVDLNDSSDISVVKSIRARYAEYSGEFVQLEIDPEDIMDLNRRYDTDTIEVESVLNKQANIIVQSYVGEEKSDIIKMKLVLEENGWRLDTPTY